MNASVIALEISDLPPPDTVHGLWQEVDSGTGADEAPLGAVGGDLRHLRRGSRSGRRYTLSARSRIDGAVPSGAVPGDGQGAEE